jgi:hypothetical protein
MCIAIFTEHAKSIFGVQRWGWGLIQSRFDHRALEQITIQTLQTLISHTGVSAETVMMRDHSPNACKAFVTATPMRDARKGSPFLFRTYPGRERMQEECKIWEAIRATCAAPSFFDPIIIGDEAFVDGGFGCNNPVNVVYEEAMMQWPGQEIGYILSLGTGTPRVLSLHDPTLLDTRFPKGFVQTLERTATECETAHQDMLHKRELMGKYFRFNVQKGLEGVSLMEWQKLEETALRTEEYVSFAEDTCLILTLRCRYLREWDIKLRVNELAAKMVELDDFVAPEAVI